MQCRQLPYVTTCLPVLFRLLLLIHPHPPFPIQFLFTCLPRPSVTVTVVLFRGKQGLVAQLVCCRVQRSGCKSSGKRPSFAS